MGQSQSFDDTSSGAGSSAWSFGVTCCQDAGDDLAANFSRTPVVQVCCVSSCDNENTPHHPIVVQQNSWTTGSASDERFTTLYRSALLKPHANMRFQDYYRLGKKVGEGSFGDVFECFTQPISEATGLPFGHDEGDAAAGSSTKGPARRTAVKVFSLVKALRPGAGDGAPIIPNPEMEKRQQAKKIASFEDEYRTLSTLEHPHIVRMHECFQEQDTLYIVLELCRGGELYARLVQQVQDAGGGGFEEPLCRVFFKQMLQAVCYLHANMIVHRDLKTENFLLFGEPGTAEYDTVKLCDFGTSTRLSQERPRSMEHAGTLSYTAPEIYWDKGAALPADVWSMGVILYVLITGSNPFRLPGQACNRQDTILRIKQGDFEKRRPAWIAATPAAQDLVRCHLMLKEARRPSCKQSLAHPFILGTVLGPTSPRNKPGGTQLEARNSFPPTGGSMLVPAGPAGSAGSQGSRSQSPPGSDAQFSSIGLQAISGIVSPRGTVDHSMYLSPRNKIFQRVPGMQSVKVHRIDRGQLVSLAPKALRLLLRVPRLALEQRLALGICALASLEYDIKGLHLWRELFLVMDKDQDGRLGFQELVEGLRELVGTEFDRVTDEHILACAWALDFDQSGSIEWVEWLAVALMDSAGIAQSPEPLGTAFRLIQQSYSGNDGLVAMVPVTDAFSQMMTQWSDPHAGMQAGLFGPSELRSVVRSIEAYAQL